MAGKCPGQLLVVPWVFISRRADVLWAGLAPGRGVLAEGTGPRSPPAAQQIPGNQVGKPRAAHSLQPGGIEGRASAPEASALFLKWLAAGRSSHRAGRLGGHQLWVAGEAGRSSRRPREFGAFFVTRCALRTGRGLGTPSATGGEGEFGGTCLRQGSRVSAGVGSIGRPRGAEGDRSAPQQP